MLFTVPAFSAVNLKCDVMGILRDLDGNPEAGNNAQLDDISGSLLVVDGIKGYCRPTRRTLEKAERKGIDFPEELNVYIVGGGLGLRFSLAQAFNISCPLVGKKNFENKKFGGVKVQADVGVGGMVGVFSTKKLGVCFVGGIDLGLGASVSMNKMWFDTRMMQ